MSLSATNSFDLIYVTFEQPAMCVQVPAIPMLLPPIKLQMTLNSSHITMLAASLWACSVPTCSFI